MAVTVAVAVTATVDDGVGGCSSSRRGAQSSCYSGLQGKQQISLTPSSGGFHDDAALNIEILDGVQVT